MAIIRIKGNVLQGERELQENLSELITNGKSKIILDIREAELNMSQRDRFKDVIMAANRQSQQKKGAIVFLASPGKKIDLRIPDSLDLKKFYIEGQAMECLQKSCK